ncbi:hypothetical protein C3L33_23406, partial [Rhododendron williamsianum]
MQAVPTPICGTCYHDFSVFRAEIYGVDSMSTDWTLDSKKKASDVLRYSRSDKMNVISVYVDNLPYEMDKVWLHQLFRGYSEVVDVYIPNKRSFRFNTKFGFVRFKSRVEAERAVQNLNGILIRDYYIHVNLARFSQDSRSRIPLQKACDRMHEATDFLVNNIKSKEFVGDCNPSFADIIVDMVENSSNNGAEDVNGESKEAVVETDSGDDEPFDFDVDKAELEIVEEVSETNVEAEKAIGPEERALQLINVNMQGCIDKAANSSSGV